MPSRFVRLLSLLCVTIGLSGAFVTSSQAQGSVQAVATADLNMRSGPGVRYRVVFTIPRGGRVSTLRCTDRYRWCEVGFARRKGWVSARYLRDSRPRYRDRPISDIGAVIGLEIFRFVLREIEQRDRENDFESIGGAGGDRRPTPRNVCFYDRPSFKGRRFCAGIGKQAHVLMRGWRGRVASIRVGKRTSVEICSRPGYGGRCSLVTRNLTYLRRGDAVTSFRVLRRQRGDVTDFETSRRACFFEHTGFRGAGICFDAGDGAVRLPREWNNRISSVRLEGGVEARVCERSNFNGWCETIRRDLPRLRDYYNDEISSLEVY
ncbi:peptidase inhibitor family I36 protein [Nitratireductor sp. GISD-1A_MAKvit]|uniref:peptidase inhibitor family I36 protein n=1 Tax=Nitratireductor sp. GISD-1A_MAKvit TaxID=3234198 RepID=UPI00346645B7